MQERPNPGAARRISTGGGKRELVWKRATCTFKNTNSNVGLVSETYADDVNQLARNYTKNTNSGASLALAGCINRLDEAKSAASCAPLQCTCNFRTNYRILSPSMGSF